MFASVMSRIPGRKDDDLLTKHSFRGFPSFSVMDAKGEVLVRPRGRTLSVFGDAMKQAAELDKDSRKIASRMLDTEKISADFFKRVQSGKLGKATTERVVFRSIRESMTAAQRREAERALALVDLRAAQAQVDAAKLGARSGERAILNLLAAGQRLGGWSATKDSARALMSLMRWAEARKDPLLFESYLRQFERIQPKAYPKDAENEARLGRWKKRLADCWGGR